MDCDLTQAIFKIDSNADKIIEEANKSCQSMK
jgi:hypothetical protein